MPTVFDSHAHCFPALAEPGEIQAARLAETQYHVRFHGQGLLRTRDNARIGEPILAGDRDGISHLHSPARPTGVDRFAAPP